MVNHRCRIDDMGTKCPKMRLENGGNAHVRTSFLLLLPRLSKCRTGAKESIERRNDFFVDKFHLVILETFVGRKGKDVVVSRCWIALPVIKSVWAVGREGDFEGAVVVEADILGVDCESCFSARVTYVGIWHFGNDPTESDERTRSPALHQSSLCLFLSCSLRCVDEGESPMWMITETTIELDSERSLCGDAEVGISCSPSFAQSIMCVYDVLYLV